MKKVPLPTSFRSSARVAPPPARAEGFTLIELLIVIVIVGILAIIVLPNLLGQIEKAKVTSTLREASSLIQIARQEAIRRGVDVVVLADTANNRFLAFANVDDDSGLLFQPNAAAVARTVDYEVQQVPLPQGSNASNSISFWGPADATPNGGDISAGLDADSSSRPVAVFEPNGSIRTLGAFRIADARGNYFEVRIAPRATARIEIRKYYETPPFGGGVSGFFPRGRDTSSGENLWKWY